MPRGDLDRLYAERRAQVARAHRIVTAMAFIIIALTMLALGALIHFAATTPPEQIGAWLGRLSHAFRGTE